jgi:hypothetical protein
MSWGEYEDMEEIETTPYGENAMAALLIFVYNCTVKNTSTLTKYLKK